MLNMTPPRRRDQLFLFSPLERGHVEYGPSETSLTSGCILFIPEISGSNLATEVFMGPSNWGMLGIP
jgi:hypothetical protein